MSILHALKNKATATATKFNAPAFTITYSNNGVVLGNIPWSDLPTEQQENLVDFENIFKSKIKSVNYQILKKNGGYINPHTGRFSFAHLCVVTQQDDAYIHSRNGWDEIKQGNKRLEVQHISHDDQVVNFEVHSNTLNHLGYRKKNVSFRYNLKRKELKTKGHVPVAVLYNTANRKVLVQCQSLDNKLQAYVKKHFLYNLTLPLSWRVAKLPNSQGFDFIIYQSERDLSYLEAYRKIYKLDPSIKLVTKGSLKTYMTYHDFILSAECENIPQPIVRKAINACLAWENGYYGSQPITIKSATLKADCYNFLAFLGYERDDLHLKTNQLRSCPIPLIAKNESLLSRKHRDSLTVKQWMIYLKSLLDSEYTHPLLPQINRQITAYLVTL